MKNLILTVIITLCTITTFAQPAQYTPMTASGYQMKRLKVDSTLHLPSFCGVPNLVGSTAKDGALAIDTCNALLYMWTRSGGWDTVNTSGGGTTPGLQEVLNANSISIGYDMYLRDTIGDKGFNFYLNGKDGNSSPELIISNNGNINNGIGIYSGDGTYGTYPKIKFYNASEGDRTLQFPNVTTNSFIVNLPADNINQKGDDTLATLADVRNAAGGTTIDTTSLSDRINSKLSIVDTTAMLSPYLRIIDTTNKFVNRLTRTAGKDSIIYFIGGNRYAIKDSVGTTIDTSNKFVNRLTRTAGKDSIIYFVGANRFAIKDSVGTGGGGQNGRFGNDTATIVMVKVHNESGVQLTNGKVVAFSTSGTQSNEPAVRLANNKGDSTSANTLGFVTGTIAINDTGWVILSGKIEKLNTSAFSNGDIIYLDSVSGNWTKSKPQAPYHMVYLGVVVKSNAGNGSIFVKCQNGYELDEIHDLKITSPVNNQVLAYSDTQRLWKNRNIYTIVDTTSLSSRINLKLNTSDTTVFQRKSLPAYTFAANNTFTTANATTQYFKDTSGTYTGTITWANTAPTSGTFTYRWVRIGRMVNIYISLSYAVAGATNNQLIVTLPSDAPIPSKPGGLTAASNLLYTALAQINAGATTLTSSAMRAMLRSNASNNGFEFFIQCAALAATNAYITCTYFTD